MSFFEKIKQSLRSFMNGRNGADNLSMALLWSGLLFYLLGSIVGSIQGSPVWAVLGMVLSTIGFAGYVFCIFRMFSRNTSKRFGENYKFLKIWNPVKNWFQWLWLSIRYCNKNRYFLCPKCGRIACIPKKTGKVTITCKGCKHKYDRKA